MIPELFVDPERGRNGSALRHATGVKVRARLRCDGSDIVGAFDIATLDLPSLQSWLRQHGGENIFAETQFALLLGHDLQEIGKAWKP